MLNVIKNRRGFIISAGKAATAILLPFSFFGTCSKPETKQTNEENSDSAESITLDLSKAENNPLTSVGGAVKIKNSQQGSIIVYRKSSEEVIAYSSRCTHTGCELPIPTDNQIVCPCHKSIFDANGTLLSGPAKGNLPRYEASITGMKVTISI